jgi:hypothetical protein
VQPPGSQAMRNRASGQAGIQELLSNNESLLDVRDAVDLPVAPSGNVL